MRDEIRMILGQSQYFGLAVSVAAYLFAAWLRKKTKLAILNPLLISSALIIGCLVCVGMDYETYNKGAGFLGWLLTPATVCLAIPLYQSVKSAAAARRGGIDQYSGGRCHQRGQRVFVCPRRWGWGMCTM